jgi:hypothetical protein
LRERRIVLKNWNRLSNQATRRIIPTARATALAVAFAVSLPADAGKVTPPPVPDNLKVDAGNHPFLVGHADGTQNYVCAPSATGVAYVLFTPEATLFNNDGDQLITHFFSPNPDPSDPNKSAAVVADGAIRATMYRNIQSLCTVGQLDIYRSAHHRIPRLTRISTLEAAASSLL